MQADSLTALREQAAEWVVRLDAADADESVRSACEEWRSRSADHEKLFQQCRQLWQSVSPARALRRRPGVGVVLSVAVAAACLWLLPWQLWTADERAPKHGLRTVQLSDGSRLVLNDGSAVDIRFDASHRTVVLVEGEVLAEVARDAAGRSFSVVGRDGAAQAKGTRYLVRQRDSDTEVTVLESTVYVAPSAAKAGRDVRAGERVRFDAHGLLEADSAPPAADAWTQHRLVFQDAPLAEVLAALEPRHGGWLRVSGEEARKMRFTGVLPVDRPEAALQLLSRALPLQTRRLTPLLTYIEARPLE